MRTITLSRQLGSQGDTVAQALAQRQGYRVVYRELINQAAQRAGCPEMALAFLDVLGLLEIHPSAQDLQRYQQAMLEIMTELADRGKVILIGRAGCLLLKDRPDVLHVRIIAPMSLRIERIAQQQAISSAAARTQVETSDQTRRVYLQRHHQAEWDDPQLYDLVLNTGRLTVEQAAQLIEVAQSWSGLDKQAHSPLNPESDLV
jgi:cytidylate kinase